MLARKEPHFPDSPSVWITRQATIMEKYATLLIISTCVLLGSAEICTDDICQYHFVIRQWRSMTYSTPKAGYDVDLNGTRLQLVENEFRRKEEHPLIGTFVNASDVITADGYRRDVITINDQFPGPTIEVMKNAQVVIHITNEMPVAITSIHWHGLYMRGTPWMDGVGYVTQCPILPLQRFTHRFLADPPGTHWYHSHIHAQKDDGLYGLFIIHERLPTIPSYGITVVDWQHEDASTLDAQDPYSAKRRGSGEMQLPSTNRDFTSDSNEVAGIKFVSALINGRGRYENKPYPLEEFNVLKGERYRFRTVNAGAEHPFIFSIDNHQIDIVGSDGDEYLPITVDSFILLPGESIDFEILATESSGLFWLRADVFRQGNGPNPKPDGVMNGAMAIIRYQETEEGAEPTSVSRNCTEQYPCIIFNCPFSQYPTGSWITCIPLSDARSTRSNIDLDENYGLAEKDSDVVEIFLNLAFPIGASINARKYRGARAPMFHPEIDNYITHCNDDVCDKTGCVCTHIKQIPYNKTIQIVFSSLTPEAPFMAHHTVHLHGHNFAVLKMGLAEQNETTGFWSRMNQDIMCAGENEQLCSKPRWNGDRPVLNKVKPPLKDSVIVPSRGYVVVRFRSDNPGFWFLHCHQELHLLEGMTMIIHEAPGHIKPVPQGFPTCSDFEWSNEDHRAYLNDETSKNDVIPPTEVSKEPVEDCRKEEDSQQMGEVRMPLNIAIGVAFALVLLGAFLSMVPHAVFVCCQRKQSKYGM